MAKFSEAIPLPRALGDTLRDDTVLANLAWRMQQSERCLTEALAVIPVPLRPLIQAGPWDESGWTLLTRHAAALTKLRHLLPLIEKRVKDAGLSRGAVRVKVLPPGG